MNYCRMEQGVPVVIEQRGVERERSGTRVAVEGRRTESDYVAALTVKAGFLRQPANVPRWDPSRSYGYRISAH